jgi:hypothetical protein
MKLLNAIEELESYVNKQTDSNLEISNSTIGWQIVHALKVVYGVTRTIAKSDPKDYKWQFNFTRTLILTTGKIPRGKAKAPKAVRPLEEDMTAEALVSLFEKTKKAINDTLNSESKAYFEHPYFGLLKRDTAIRFLEVHTEHHLKIIRDIAK